MSTFCLHKRVLRISSKTCDCFNITGDDIDYEGYVPEGLNLGGGDYIEFSYCIDCGKIMGQFPISEEDLKDAVKDCDEDQE
jgi:hypothetical protein